VTCPSKWTWEKGNSADKKEIWAIEKQQIQRQKYHQPIA